ncbi:unnamed protein product [Mytilus edulis]|uniref:Uncharacterized protein n=1 Tax=Mytilus edulis TaxID=6550 RepID=A0A8S3QWV3_MYTED|nr:unnamed protein product [Mytilus edulis]
MFLATSLRENAQSVSAYIDPIKRKYYKSICAALTSRFGTENRTELFRVQLKNIRKRKDQELPELAQHIKRYQAVKHIPKLNWNYRRDEDIDCIISFDFMKPNMCCIDVANNTMTVNKEQISCAVLNTQAVRCCRVAVSETIVIPPGVPGKVLDISYAPECSMIVPTDKLVEKHQLMLAKTVVNSSSDVFIFEY